MRIAFHDIANSGWTAGVHYYKNLFLALRALNNTQRPQICLLQWQWSETERYDAYSNLADEVLLLPPDPPGPPAPNFWKRQLSRLQQRLTQLHVPAPRKPILESFLRENNIDAIFTCWGEYGENFEIPLLGWIPDFQHVHLPNLFPETELRYRDDLFARMAQRATRIVLSSHDAEHDFGKFIPEQAAKARVLQFVSHIPENVYASDPTSISARYHLPERFIYLPNQFWQHKNHPVVIQALAELKQTHPEITVVCSGNTNDNRASLYFGELLAQVSQLDLRNNFLLLGWIPQAHIFQLMRQSLAVLQPSLFEGWSTTVEETKSLGKFLLLSDIPVHREQAPQHARFFDPHDPLALADCFVQVYEEKSPGPDAALEAEARAELPQRTRKFGETFMQIVLETL